MIRKYEYYFAYWPSVCIYVVFQNLHVITANDVLARLTSTLNRVF